MPYSTQGRGKWYRVHSLVKRTPNKHSIKKKRRKGFCPHSQGGNFLNGEQMQKSGGNGTPEHK